MVAACMIAACKGWHTSSCQQAGACDVARGKTLMLNTPPCSSPPLRPQLRPRPHAGHVHCQPLQSAQVRRCGARQRGGPFSKSSPFTVVCCVCKVKLLLNSLAYDVCNACRKLLTDTRVHNYTHTKHTGNDDVITIRAQDDGDTVTFIFESQKGDRISGGRPARRWCVCM